MKSTPKRFRREILVLLIMLGIIALIFSHGKEPEPRVTISGLTLNMTTDEVVEKVGSPDFRSRAYGAYIMEYWENKDRRLLKVWSQDDVVYKIEGGTPEIDGIDVGRYDVKQVVRLLGPPQNAGNGGEVGSSGHSFLSYPEYRLLVQRTTSNTRFVLFKSGRV